MHIQATLDAKSWAERTFGGVHLHDLRRTRRTVQAAMRLAENPQGSLPAQMQTWKATKALYRLLSEEDVTFAALMQPHFEQTRAQATTAPVILLVQDTTDIDLSHRQQISGVGQIGNERGRGFFLQTVLVVQPATGAVLGCIAQEPFVRIPAPKARRAVSTAQTRATRNRRVDAPGAGHRHLGPRQDLGACWGPRRGYVPVLSDLPAEAHALFGPGCPEPAGAGRRHRAQLFAEAGPLLAEPGEPPVRGARPAWARRAYDPAPGGLGAADALAPASGAASRQGATDGVGHAGLGRAGANRGGASGMDAADVGAHHHA
jgi:hypothetical protein